MSRYLERMLTNPNVSPARKRERADGRIRKLQRAGAKRRAVIEQASRELAEIDSELARLQEQFGSVELTGDPSLDEAEPGDLVALKIDDGEIKVFVFSETWARPIGGAVWMDPLPLTAASVGGDMEPGKVWAEVPEQMGRSFDVPGYVHAAYAQMIQHRSPALLDALVAKAKAEGRPGLPLQLGFSDRVIDLGVADMPAEKFEAFLERETARGGASGPGGTTAKADDGAAR